MKIKFVSPFLIKVILTAVGILTLSCAYIGKVSEETETPPNANIPITPTEISQNSNYDNQARFVIKISDIQNYEKYGYITEYGYINQKGNVVISPQFIGAGNFHEGLAAVQDSETWLWGYIDPSGKYVIEPTYYSVSNFSEGLAFVQLPDSNDLLCVDQGGKKIFELLNQDVMNSIIGSAYNDDIMTGYGGAYEFHDGIALIDIKISEDPEYWEPNYVDRQGNLIFPEGSIQYWSASSFSNGFAVVLFTDSTDEISIIDKKGNKVAKVNDLPGFSVYNSPINFPFVEDVVPVFTVPDAETGYDVRVAGYVDVSGNFVIPPQYLSAKSFSEGLAAVKDVQTELWGYIDHSGTLVIPYKFTLAREFSEGLAPVLLPENQCGFINNSGDVVLDLCVDLGNMVMGSRYIVGFHNGLAYVTDGEKTGYIDKQGNFVYIDQR